MAEPIKAQLQTAMKEAMKSGDKTRLGAIRLMMAAIKQREVDERCAMDDSQVIAILDKMLKQRRESIKLYQEAARTDLAEAEEAEITVIQDFLPAALSADEISNMVTQAITDTDAETIRDMGKVMGKLKPLMQGRADMSIVSSHIKELLGGA